VFITKCCVLGIEFFIFFHNTLTKYILTIMKSFYLPFVLLFCLFFSVQTIAQPETVGTTNGTASYTANAWSNTVVVYTGTGDTRSTQNSTGYVGVSGGRNVFLTSGGTRTLIISGITPVAGATSGNLCFGVYKNDAAANSSLTISVTNATSAASSVSLGTGASWSYQCIALTSFTGSPIIITFTNTSATMQYRLDDISLQNTVLPVGLTSFEGAINDAKVVLSFASANESNNSHFDIERSADGLTFNKIGEVKGAGTSSQDQRYRFLDEAPLKGINYYRLKQVDYDGRFVYSNVIAVRNKNKSGMTLLPTVVTDEVQINLDANLSEESGEWQVLDLFGRVVTTGPLDKEQSSVGLDLSSLQSGGYIVCLRFGSEVLTQRIMKI
jgi:hypothetical protein